MVDKIEKVRAILSKPKFDVRIEAHYQSDI